MFGGRIWQIFCRTLGSECHLKVSAVEVSSQESVIRGNRLRGKGQDHGVSHGVVFLD